MNYYNIQETSARIRQLRIELGYTQSKASELLEIDKSSLSHIEKGTKGCSVDLLMRIAETYSTTVDYLLIGRDLDGSVTGAILDNAIHALAELRRKL